MANVDLLEIHEAGPGEHVQGEALEAVVAHVEDLGPDVDVVRDRVSPRSSTLHRHLARLPETPTWRGAGAGAGDQGGQEQEDRGQV